MNLTKDEIKQIEQAADGLKKRADNQSYNPPSATIVQLSASWRYKQLILLLCAKTNLGAKVERDFTAINKLHAEYESWRGKTLTEDNEEEFTILVDSLKGTLYDLSETLHCIAQGAREELSREELSETGQKTPPAKCRRVVTYLKKIPRWIYVLVIFLAALLTCIYLLWWLWITFWKK
mgnify:CR=1 FL=1